MTLVREPKQCFFCSLDGGILEELSGRRHLGGIWEAFGGSLGALWEALGAGAAMGASRASWTENAANS